MRIIFQDWEKRGAPGNSEPLLIRETASGGIPRVSDLVHITERFVPKTYTIFSVEWCFSDWPDDDHVVVMLREGKY